MTPRLKILLTEGSSTSARQTLYALGPHHTLDILDPSPLCQCRFSRYVRRWYRCPSYSLQPQAYLRYLIERLESEKYDVLLPTHEQVFLLARFRDELSRYAGLALPDFAAMDRLMSKAGFSRLLDELGLPQPQTEIVRDREGLLQPRPLPCYVKLPYSTAGQGVRVVGRVDEMAAVADEFARCGWLDGRTEVLVQQPAVGIKRSVTAVFQHGRLVGAHCDEALGIGVGGSTMALVGTRHPEVVEQVARLGSHLAWHGAMCLEYFYRSDTGQVQFIECNPRICETVNALLCGVNLCDILVRVSRNEQVAPREPRRQGIRTHQGFLILMALALDGAGRGRLLREILRSWGQRGLYRDSADELTRPREDWLSIFPALGVSLLLLCSPRAAQRLVSSTVANYSLHQEAVETMRQLPFVDPLRPPAA